MTMSWNNFLFSLFFGFLVYLLFFGARPFWKPRKKTAKTFEEFLAFVHKQGCQYVAVSVHEDLVLHTSDDGETTFYVVADTMNPWGAKFAYSERTGNVIASHDMRWYWEARAKNNRRAQEVYENIKEALVRADNPVSISLRIRTA